MYSFTAIFRKAEGKPSASQIPIAATALYQKYCMTQSVLIFYVLITNMITLVTKVNFFYMDVKKRKQGSECTRIISLLEKILPKHYNVFHISDTADEFIKLFCF